MFRKLLGLLALLVLSNYTLADTNPKQPSVTMDENLWITFYDLPSRRFRAIRSDFVKREFDTAASNLVSSSVFLMVEADRATPALAERLDDVSNQLTWIAGHVEDTSVTLADLDVLFGRAHWLLAQHYLDMAKQSRDMQLYRNEGLYLWATTHHLERTVLWSNARIDRDLHNTLEGLRDLASDLQDTKLAAKAHQMKPLLRAEKTLRQLGAQIDRPIVLPNQ